MKLNKSKLTKLTEGKLKDIGYIKLTDSLVGANVFYAKCIENDFFLSLGLTISNFYDSRFTGSFYLSKTTLWGAIWSDIPKRSYKRLGRFLLDQERKIFLSEEFNGEGVIDAWWDGSDAEVQNFVDCVTLTEKRFLEQPNLFEEVNQSQTVNKLLRISNLIIATEKDINDENSIFKFTPSNPISNIPLSWFKAAELVLQKEKEILNKDTVKMYAADAWRIHLLKK